MGGNMGDNRDVKDEMEGKDLGSRTEEELIKKVQEMLRGTDSNRKQLDIKQTQRKDTSNRQH